MIIETVLGKIEEFDTTGRAIDKIMLDHHDLAKPHQKVKTDSGMELAISLPHGQSLSCGAVLYQDDKKLAVVDLLPEDVLEIRPRGNQEWAKAGFNMGNMHHPAYLYTDCILVPYDSIIENLIQSMGIPFQRCQRKLDGHKANHTYGHSHSHSGHRHTHK